MTYELQEMTAGLKVLHAGIRNSYESSFLEPYFLLAADAEEDGYRVQVSFFLPNTMDGDDTAEVSCHMSSQEMGDLIAELDKLCAYEVCARQDADHTAIRLVTSFATQPSDVDGLLSSLKAALA